MTFIDASKPFIKRFTNNGYYYIYDVNTNRIIRVEKAFYDIIGDYDENDLGLIETKYKGVYEDSVITDGIGKIRDAIKTHGFFSTFRPKVVSMGIRSVEAVKKLHGTYGLNQLLLELTRQCNLNCRYCQTSGKYAPHNAMHNMTKETCKKAVDLFCARTMDVEEPAISFYGGEPLMKFDLMKEIVEYVKKTYGRNKYTFNLTTNGALLNQKIIDFFIEHDFLLMVSLDGPEHVNDRYRVTRDGKGTFHTIMKNLEFLKRYNSDYFSRKVSISSVLAPPFDNIDDILDFFSTNKILEEIRSRGSIRSSLVDTRDTTFIDDFGLEESTKEYHQVSDTFSERLKAAILARDLSTLTIEKSIMHSILQNLSKRAIRKLHEHVQPLGACHIGLRRVFVRTNGDFYICERAGDDYKIGCVDTGFDYETIAGYYRKLEEVLADCRNCWAISYCDRCWAVMGDIYKFSGEDKEKFCSYQKKIIEKAFKVYTELLREAPDCLKVFKNSE